MGLTGAEWANDLSPYLFSNAGSEMYAPAGGGPLEQWQSALVVLGWVVLGLGAGALLLKRRDA